MIKDMPDTSTSAITKALIELRSSGGAITLSRVMTFLVSVESHELESAIEPVVTASYDHPSRVLVVARGQFADATRLDGQIRVGRHAGAGEVIILTAHGELVRHLDSLVTPLLLPDAPIVAWWPGAPPQIPARDALGAIASRRITDMATLPPESDPVKTIAAGYTPGDTDLAWSRITLWRRVLASAIDDVTTQHGGRVPTITQVVTHAASNSPSGDLLGAWLGERLRCPVTKSRDAVDTGINGVQLKLDEGSIDVFRGPSGDVTLSRPGTPARSIHLPQRTDAECLDEELSRLDPDPIYRETLHAAAQ